MSLTLSPVWDNLYLLFSRFNRDVILQRSYLLSWMWRCKHALLWSCWSEHYTIWICNMWQSFSCVLPHSPTSSSNSQSSVLTRVLLFQFKGHTKVPSARFPTCCGQVDFEAPDCLMQWKLQKVSELKGLISVTATSFSD